ncbi:Vlp protein, delta subfamily (plasmid) [Borrelia crocidurae str. Achema]|uniref:Variable large protein n=2 Tax=Borrelia crocidurae TaxID=29520 RepID=I0FEI6_BORCA|nr:Vlp protein, delta subfamily [Borrelia crocidurae str. Achema]
MKIVKGKLGRILEEHGSYEKVKGKVEEFIGKINKIEEGAKEAAKGAAGDDVIGGATKDGGQDPAPADSESVKALVKGIKEIVGVVLGENEGNAEASKTGENDKKDIGKLFEKKESGTDAEAAKASASIGAVSGADVLQAIAKSSETADNNKNIEEAKDAAGIAAAKKEDDKKEIKEGAKKDAVIAGGIALRGMAKGGKFAAKNEEKSANAVNGVVASAVNKVLSTLIMAIRNRVDEGLKGISEVLGEIKQGEGSETKVSE